MSTPAFTGQDIGNPSIHGATQRLAPGCLLTGGGADIWMQSDQFHFAWTPWEGDFEFTARVTSLQPSHLYAKAGLMARATLEPNSPHVYLLAFPDNQPRNHNNGGIEGHVRAKAGEKTVAIYPPAPLPPEPDFPVRFPAVWLRLRRRGDEFTLWHGCDRSALKLFGATPVALPRRLHLGLAVTSHDDAKQTQAGFQDLSLA